jgi:hypothetical protein
VEQVTTQTDCDAFTAQASAITEGIGKFKAPSSMLLGETATVQLAIGAQGGPDPTPILNNVPGATQTIDQPKIGRHMVAELSGEGFTVTPTGPQQQELPPGSNAVWSWAVHADTQGEHVLVLKTSVQGKGTHGHLVTLMNSTLNTQILVKVGPGQRLMNALSAMPVWLNALTAAVAALATLAAAVFGLLRVLKKREKS